MQTLKRYIDMLVMLYLLILLVLKSDVFAFENMALHKNVFESNPWRGMENWRGENAVDGRYTDRSAAGGQCVISENNKETAEWRVDLGSVVSISHIDIYYRTDNLPKPTVYTARMAGFFLYVSNTTTKEQGYICFHELQNAVGTPSLDQRINCPIHGRYVIYYNERRMGFDYPSYYSKSAYYELCELEVYGCSREGVYGVQCDQQCPINCQDRRCDINTGHCLGCLPGYKGSICDQVCQQGFYGIGCADICNINCNLASCNRVTGHCDRGCNSGWTGHTCNQHVCQEGLYGRYCRGVCSKNCFYSSKCDRFTGHCYEGCKQGWTGSKCDQRKKCPPGFYGIYCSSECSVNCYVTRQCDPTTGHCNNGCTQGWTGNKCEQKCQPGFYGIGCSHQCSVNCYVTRQCDPSTGHCNNGCTQGWTGNTCEQKCQPGFYGIGCSHQCSVNCYVARQCDSSTGHCNNGCTSGWTGNTCDLHCDPGRFGNNCMQRCSVNCNVTSICDRYTGRCDGGCKLGWKGDTCDQNGFQLCDNGYFGAECNRKCGHCLQTDHCNHVNGSCLNGCFHGYKGDYCNETCPPGFFGLDCINRCDNYCSGNESCDPVLGICTEGCKRGWSGLICGLERLNRQSYGDNMPIVVGVVVSVVIIFGGSIIHVILWKRKIRATLQVPSDGPSETSRQYTELDNINKPSNYDEIHSYSNHSNL